MKYTKYAVTNTETGVKTTIKIPSRFDKATPENLVLNIEQDDIEYNTFKMPDDQRETNTRLQNKLETSIEKNGQLVPASILEDGTNAEGNHRFDVCEITGKPFKFIVDKGEHGLTQEQLTKEINQSQINWEIGDWLHKWVVKGLEPYVRFERFLERHKFGQIYNALQVFSHKGKGAGTFRDEFEGGTFNPTEDEWKNAEAFMGEIKDVSKVWNPSGAAFKSYFIGAYREVKHHPNFSPTKFVTRLKKYRSEFRECAKSKDYIDLINIIYNKGLQATQKIWLA